MNDKKKHQDTAEKPTDLTEDKPALKPARHSEHKIIRNVSPLGMRVLVKIKDVDNITEGGLYLPEGAKKNLSESLIAEVMEVASAHDIDTDEETNVSGIPLGATVLIPKEAGTAVPWDDTVRIVETKDILAIVEEMILT